MVSLARRMVRTACMEKGAEPCAGQQRMGTYLMAKVEAHGSARRGGGIVAPPRPAALVEGWHTRAAPHITPRQHAAERSGAACPSLRESRAQQPGRSPTRLRVSGRARSAHDLHWRARGEVLCLGLRPLGAVRSARTTTAARAARGTLVVQLIGIYSAFQTLHWRCLHFVGARGIP